MPATPEAIKEGIANSLNRKQEDFCRRIARGESQAAAYLGAGYVAANGSARKLGWRLAQVPKVKKRIEELREIVGEAKSRWLDELPPTRVFRRKLDRDYVLDTLMEITERCMQHHVITDAQGKPIEVDGPDGKRCLLVGFRPKEATRAVELLGKELGMFVERMDATHRFEERYRTMTPEEREADAEALADEVRRLLGRQQQEQLEAQATDADAVEVGPNDAQPEQNDGSDDGSAPDGQSKDADKQSGTG